MASSRKSDPAAEAPPGDEATVATAAAGPADGSETPTEFKITAFGVYLIIKAIVLIVILLML